MPTKLSPRPWFTYLLLLTALAIMWRWWWLRDGAVFFYFDQARDAVISQQIWQNGDIKLQGPSVSGTNDSVYHGVLYYYVVGLLYTITNGHPVLTAGLLAVLGSSGVLIAYQLAKQVFASHQVGWLTAVLVAGSALSVHQHLWLSNPMLTSVLIPATYYWIWQLWWSEPRPTHWSGYVILGALLAASVQAALQSVVLLGSVLIALIYVTITSRRWPVTEWRSTFALGLTFILGIATMLATQWRMWHNGILTLTTLHLTERTRPWGDLLATLLPRYTQIINDALWPHGPRWLALIWLVVVAYFNRHLSRRHIIWLLSFALAPLWLLVWHYRDPPHTFIALDYVVYMLSAHTLGQWWQKNTLGKISVGVMLVLFVVAQQHSLTQWHEQQVSYYGIQRGALWRAQKELIDLTYQTAHGAPFSIDTITSPYGINTTWSYLYAWYGQSKYGYLPSYTGWPQAGHPGAGLLTETSTPQPIHFTIWEPDTTLPARILQDYAGQQTQLAGPVVGRWEFGTLRLEKRMR